MIFKNVCRTTTTTLSLGMITKSCPTGASFYDALHVYARTATRLHLVHVSVVTISFPYGQFTLLFRQQITFLVCCLTGTNLISPAPRNPCNSCRGVVDGQRSVFVRTRATNRVRSKCIRCRDDFRETVVVVRGGRVVLATDRGDVVWRRVLDRRGRARGGGGHRPWRGGQFVIFIAKAWQTRRAAAAAV